MKYDYLVSRWCVCLLILVIGACSDGSDYSEDIDSEMTAMDSGNTSDGTGTPADTNVVEDTSLQVDVDPMDTEQVEDTEQTMDTGPIDQEDVLADSVEQDVDESGDSGHMDASDGSVVLSSCESNVDCRGGEVCRDNLCREACSADNPCSGPLSVCDVEEGICVVCVQDEQCGANQACVDHECAFYCREDAACAPDEFCAMDSGTCTDRQCESNMDCMGGFLCQRFGCVAIDDIVCEANERICDGVEAVLQCSPDGTQQDRFDCPGGTVCVQSDDRTECNNLVCTANELGCADTDLAFVCDDTGTVRTDLPCGENQYCDAGLCEDQVCEPESAACDGDVRVTCNALGSLETRTPCAQEPQCDIELGCACANAACEPRVCRPDRGRCVGNDSAQACSDDGLSWGDIVPCEDDETCVLGSCLPTVCTDGERQCQGNVLLSCNDSGTGYDEDDCEQRGEVCTDEGMNPRCVAPICEPGGVGCLDRTTVYTCGPRGLVQTPMPCDEEFVCIEGACVDQICDPDIECLDDIDCEGERICMDNVCSFIDGDVRLVGGPNRSAGRVEMYFSGEWGTVCDDGFGRDDAEVVCRQLGFTGVEAVHVGGSPFGSGTGQIWLDNLACVGDEMSLLDCGSNGIGSHNCSHNEDVGVTCEGTLCETNVDCEVGEVCSGNICYPEGCLTNMR